MATRSWLPALWPDAREGDPFLAMRKQMDSLLDDWTRALPERAPLPQGSLLSPKIDVSETAAEVRIAAELPGVEEKDVEVALQGDVLVIRGEKRSESEETDDNKGRHYHRVERSYGAFQRSFALPDGIAADKVTADFKNGVLTVLLPKSPAAAGSRKIDVKKS